MKSATPVLLQQRLTEIGCEKLPDWVATRLCDAVGQKLKEIKKLEETRCVERISKRQAAFVRRAVTRQKVAQIIAVGLGGSADVSEGRKGDDSPLPKEGF